MMVFFAIYLGIFAYLTVCGVYYYNKYRTTYPRSPVDWVTIYIYVIVSVVPVLNALICCILILWQLRELARPKWK